MDVSHNDPRAGSARLSTAVVVAALVGIVGFSLFLHLRDVSHDLPAPGADEPYFVLPAARMAWRGDANPQWFGHPGSTVIYPLAVAYRAREVVFHGAPLFGEASSLAERFRSDPSSFYEIGRLWVILLSVATIPLVFVVGRRAFDDVTALIAAGCWSLVPLALQYGTIVRTDAAGACFALLSLWACLVALDRPRVRQFVLAGGAIGLAIASRYFLVTLLGVLGAVWVVARRRDPQHVTLRAVVLGCVAAGAVFAVTTPFFFVDWHGVARSLEAETVGTVTNDRSGWIENVAYYAGNAIPSAISWVAVVFGIVGSAIALARRDTRRVLLVGFVLLFVAVISLSSLHWQRWIIQLLPIVLLLAASAVVTAARVMMRAAAAPSVRRVTAAGTIVLGTVALAAAPAASLVDYEHEQGLPSTRALMRSWIADHVPKGSLIATEVKGPELRTLGYRVLDRYDLPTDGTLGDYTAHGYRYLVVNAFVALRYRLDVHRYPVHARFYTFLRERGDLLAQFGSENGAVGPHLKLYYLDPRVVAGGHHRINRAVCSRSRHDRLGDPPPMYPVGEEILGEPHTTVSSNARLTNR